jgi:hypothetical protein
MSRHDHFTYHNGPFAMTAGCNFCKHVEIARKPPKGRGMLGKGWGFTAMSLLRKAMNEHIRAKHPEALEPKP